MVRTAACVLPGGGLSTLRGGPLVIPAAVLLPDPRLTLGGVPALLEQYDPAPPQPALGGPIAAVARLATASSGAVGGGRSTVEANNWAESLGRRKAWRKAGPRSSGKRQRHSNHTGDLARFVTLPLTRKPA